MLACDPSIAVLVIEGTVVKVVARSSNDDVDAEVRMKNKLYSIMCLGSVTVCWSMGCRTMALALGRSGVSVSHRGTAGTSEPSPHPSLREAWIRSPKKVSPAFRGQAGTGSYPLGWCLSREPSVAFSYLEGVNLGKLRDTKLRVLVCLETGDRHEALLDGRAAEDGVLGQTVR